MRKLLRNEQGEWNTQIVIALIGATATLLTAVVAGIFGLIQLRAGNDPPPAATATPPVALTAEIEGPITAALNEQTFFTIISENADRAEWSVAGFGSDEIDPFDQSDQVFVQPTDAARVGEFFTLMVTVYDDDGRRADARHRFQIVSGD